MFIQPSYTMLLKVAGTDEHELAQDAHVHTCVPLACVLTCLYMSSP